MIKFLHLRNKSTNNQLDPRGGVTIAYTPLNEKFNYWGYHIAICSKKDNYCKARGRTIAQGRLEKAINKGGSRFCFSGTKEQMIKEIMQIIENKEI
jgi:hypothetical protein